MPFKITAQFETKVGELTSHQSFSAEGENFAPEFSVAFMAWISKVTNGASDDASIARILTDASKVQAIADRLKADAAALNATAPEATT